MFHDVPGISDPPTALKLLKARARASPQLTAISGPSKDTLYAKYRSTCVDMHAVKGVERAFGRACNSFDTVKLALESGTHRSATLS